MRTTLIFILFIGFSFISKAHDYYFGYAEVEYNATSQRFEGTIIFTTHDFEKSIQKEHPGFPLMDTITVNSEPFKLISEKILKGFGITVNGNELDLQLVGIENYLTGTTNIYFESEKIELMNDITFEFDLLMDEYEGQQNKISFKMENRKETLYFINNEKRQTLNLNTKE